MDRELQGSFFDAFSPKNAFIMGIVAAVLALGTLGFVIMLTVGLRGGLPSFKGASGNPAPVADAGAQPAPAENLAANLPPVTDKDHVRGASSAKLTIVEYSDFECPFCQRFHPTMQKILENFGTEVRWVYRHFPLDGLHVNARAAAEASECVADIGGNEKFWAFADKVIEGGAPASADRLTQYAGEVGVNAGRYEECVKQGKFADRVREMEQGGAAAGVRGTPGNYLVEADGNVSEIPGAQPYEVIEPVLKQLLGKT